MQLRMKQIRRLLQQKKTETEGGSKVAAMQRDFESLPLLRQVYHEAPDDVFELIVSKCYDLDENRWGRGGLNSFRLANKRLKKVVESCHAQPGSRIDRRRMDHTHSLFPSFKDVGLMIDDIRCVSHNLRSLEGCPDGLKKLSIGEAPHLSDLSPLASCSMIQGLQIFISSITDISFISSMPLLEMIGFQKDEGCPSVEDLSPLSSCTKLRRLALYDNCELQDLSPLSVCTALEELEIS